MLLYLVNLDRSGSQKNRRKEEVPLQTLEEGQLSMWRQVMCPFISEFSNTGSGRALFS